ncbi:MAG: AGE family epimerase/isomerase [Clostridia bacterium]|nr:AGE family epimerase/isomerase [Clostridia bacterium]
MILNPDARIRSMTAEMEAQLKQTLLPFWSSLRDDFGFIGYVGIDLKRNPAYMRGCILNSRILWFFSRAYRLLGEKTLLDNAAHAYRALIRMTDPQNGGVYWALNPDGTVCDGTKHCYNQAFAIYSLSAYYEVSRDEEALKRAFSLFDTIETKMRDEGGYLEAFTADFKPAGNDKLSENGVEAGRTMNTLLHVLEGYTELYRVSKSDAVRQRLYEILRIWQEHIWNDGLSRQEVFFDRAYRSLIDLYSYGHDIETSWLMDRTLDILGDEALTLKLRPKLMRMAGAILQRAQTSHGLPAEAEKGVVNPRRDWWVQAEALLGYMNAWHRGEGEAFLTAALNQWEYIKNKVLDKRPGSEWFSCLDENDMPVNKPMVDEWKCPYHNGRMIFEMMETFGK